LFDDSQSAAVRQFHIHSQNVKKSFLR